MFLWNLEGQGPFLCIEITFMNDIQIGCICLVDQTVMRSLPGAQRLLHECSQAQCPLAFTHCGATGFYLAFSFSHQWNTEKQLWQYSLLDKVFVLVNFQTPTPESSTGAIRENILPVELGQYWLFQYWPSSIGSIFSSIDPVANSGVAALNFTTG